MDFMQQPMPNPEDISDPTTAMNMALALMAKAFKLNYSTPTNNNQRISSNPRNRTRLLNRFGGNQNGYNAVQNVGNQGIANQNANQIRNGNVVAARAEGNVVGNNGNQIRCYNCRGLGHLARNCTARPRRRDAAYLQTQLLIAQKEEAGIQLQAEEFDFMAAAGDLDEIEEVDANCILMANLQQASTSGTQTDKAPVYDSDGSAELSMEKSTVSSLLEEKKKLKSDFKIREDELLDKQILLENKIKELDNILVKMGQSIQTMHMLSPKPDSFYHTEQKMALGYQNPFYLKKAQQKQQSLYNGKVLLEKHDPPVVYDSEETLQLAQESRLKMKQLNKEIKPANYTKINHLSGVFVSQMAKSREESYFTNTSKMATVSKSISIPNEEFSDDTTPSVARKFLNEVKGTIMTLQQAAKFVRDFKSLANEADESLDKQKTLEREIDRLLRVVVSQEIMSIVQNTSVVDSSNLQTELDRTKERFENCIIKKENEYAKLWNDWYKKCEECKYDKISYDKAYNDMHQKIERLQAQLGDLKGKRVNNTAKTRRPQPRSNTKNDRVTSVSKSSCSKNKEIKVEEHHRNLLLSKKMKHMSSECNNVKLAIQNVKSKVVCAMCKQCLISANHDACVLNYVNDMNSRGKKQKPKVWKPKNVGSNVRLASPKPMKPRTYLRWSPTGRSFDLTGKIIESSNVESHSDCSNGDNACTSNPQEPKSKWFPNFTLSLAGHSNLFMVRRLGMFKAHDRKSEASNKFCLEVLGNYLEVAFRKNTCFVRNLEGVDLLKGSRTINLYTINLHEMASASPICLMARATSTKSWLWHQRLSYLNFDTIYDLARNDLVTGLPKFKYHKEHLCPSYIGKLGAKGDIGFFIGYSAYSCAYRVYNRRTKKMIETMNVTFNELSAMAFEQSSSKPGLQSMSSGQISSGLGL
ncbi:retrovirus-related pol polyprotein from transposon TNT 1-94 [Tanacetum coccineum]